MTCLSLRLGLAALSCSIGLRNCLKNLSLWACSSKEQIVILGQLFRPQDKFSGLIFAPRTKYFILECHFVLQMNECGCPNTLFTQRKCIIWEKDDIFSLNGCPLKQKSSFLSFLDGRKTKQCTFWANNVQPDPRILKRCHFPTYISVGWKLGMFGFS